MYIIKTIPKNSYDFGCRRLTKEQLIEYFGWDILMYLDTEENVPEEIVGYTSYQNFLTLVYTEEFFNNMHV